MSQLSYPIDILPNGNLEYINETAKNTNPLEDFVLSFLMAVGNHLGNHIRIKSLIITLAFIIELFI